MPKSKIISFTSACSLSHKFQKEGKQIIFTSGCFDILHIGHIEFFNKILRWKKPNHVIFVGVDDDSYIQIVKSHPPYFPQITRAKVLSALSVIDYVVLLQPALSSNTFVHRYKQLQPEIVIFGNTEPEVLKKIKTEVKKAGSKFKHFPHPTKLESTSRIAKILDTYFPS